MIYEAQKPIWQGTDIINIAIRESVLLEAIKLRESVKVVYGDKSQFIDPKVWMKNGTLIKKVFRFENNPMRLWQGNVRFEKPKTAEQGLEEMAKTYLL